MESSGTELAEALKAVRDGLAAAQRDGEGSPFRFTVKDVTLDLGIELRHSASAGGGVKAFVVSADARGEREKTETHKLTVNLQLHRAEDHLISDEGRGFDSLPGEAPLS
ncbi:trypco2 family protein [Streptomyces lunalinharesii]|uniref:Trypsin-co-occurring domain-containing protein n=1 Tax=Streptomyces lunalinharesii TaxID=333384 RepID=A0ABN3RKA5_9ACTN